MVVVVQLEAMVQQTLVLVLVVVGTALVELAVVEL